MTTFLPLLHFELSAARRARTVTVVAGGFALAAVAVALVGLSSGGSIEVQGFARTSMSLMQLILWVIPALALLLGASLGAECLELEFQASLPAPRRTMLIARWLAWVMALGGAVAIGLGAAGILIGVLAGPTDGWRYLRLLGVSGLLLAACLAIGVWIGVLARTRTRAMALAIVAWFLLVVGIDLLAIAALAILPKGQASWELAVLLMMDPVDSARVLAVALLQADVVAGPMGPALRKVLGGVGVWALVLAMLGWIALPLLAAARRFTRADL